MLNWIKFISVFLIALSAVIVMTVFYSAHKPIASAKETAAQAALSSDQITAVEKVQPYNGTESSVTVFGRNKNNEKIAVFVNDYDAEKFPEVKLADGVTQEEAIKAVKKEHKTEKVLHALLGMEDNEPIWEVAFKSENGKLNYVYILFKDGEWSKRILNL